MAARKRASTQSKFLNRAVKAGKSALRQAQRRLPPDVRKQIEKTVKDGQKTVHAAIKQVETRLDRTARQADLEKALKRLDELSRQVRNMAAAAAASAAAARTSGPTTRRAATRKSATRATATRKTATRKASTRKAVPGRSPARRSTRKVSAAASEPSASASNGEESSS
jgi:polyhydroxyalkanoate synthesis regulator phasin